MKISELLGLHTAPATATERCCCSCHLIHVYYTIDIILFGNMEIIHCITKTIRVIERCVIFEYLEIYELFRKIHDLVHD